MENKSKARVDAEYLYNCFADDEEILLESYFDKVIDSSISEINDEGMEFMKLCEERILGLNGSLVKKQREVLNKIPEETYRRSPSEKRFVSFFEKDIRLAEFETAISVMKYLVKKGGSGSKSNLMRMIGDLYYEMYELSDDQEQLRLSKDAYFAVRLVEKGKGFYVSDKKTIEAIVEE